jgi:hypothetical protein
MSARTAPELALSIRRFVAVREKYATMANVIRAMRASVISSTAPTSLVDVLLGSWEIFTS